MKYENDFISNRIARLQRIDEKVELVKQYFLKEYLQSILPKFCLRLKCLKRNKMDKYF